MSSNSEVVQYINALSLDIAKLADLHIHGFVTPEIVVYPSIGDLNIYYDLHPDESLNVLYIAMAINSLPIIGRCAHAITLDTLREVIGVAAHCKSEVINMLFRYTTLYYPACRRIWNIRGLERGYKDLLRITFRQPVDPEDVMTMIANRAISARGIRYVIDSLTDLRAIEMIIATIIKCKNTCLYRELKSCDLFCHFAK